MTRGILPILSNRPELVADRDLQELVAAAGDRLFSKVALSEVLDIDDSKVTKAADRRFLLMASFDFTVSRNNYPLFCVEIDGRRHSTDPATIERDRKKDAACEAVGLPLLRLSSDLSLRRSGKRSILKYLADCFYLFEAFYEAQKVGAIPWDEPFARSALTEWNEDGIAIQSMDQEAISILSTLGQGGCLPSRIPEVIAVSVPERRNVRCVTVLAVATDRFLVADVQVRDFRFVGVRPSELAESLALMELVTLARRWINQDAVAVNLKSLTRTFGELQDAIDRGLLCFASTSGGGNARAAGGYPSLTIHFGHP